MATATLEIDDFLCSICLDSYYQPKTLVCGHNFCEDCIERTLFQGEDGKDYVMCPVCRKETLVPEDGLATNFILNSLAEQFSGLNKVSVIHSNMSSEMETVAKRSAWRESKETTPGEVAFAMANHFNLKYGKYWHCIVSRKENDWAGYHMTTNERENNYFIKMLAFECRIELFKTGQDIPCWKCAQCPCDGTKCKFLSPEVIKCNMKEAMAELAKRIAFKAAKQWNSPLEIAKTVKTHFDVEYGDFWQCFVGPRESPNATAITPRNGKYINFTLSNIHIRLFKANKDPWWLFLRPVIFRLQSFGCPPILREPRGFGEN